MKNVTMMQVKGLIIKETNVGEGDKIITILTNEHGKIQAGANRARSYKSKLTSGCSLFCYTDFIIKKGKQLGSVTSAEPIETFYNIRTDIEKLSLATYFCDLLCEIATDSNGMSEIIQLALNTLYIITKKEDLTLVKPTFELRLMALSGLSPNVLSCGRGNDCIDLKHFSVNEGSVFCSECGNSFGEIKGGTLSAMQHILHSDARKIYSFSASPEVAAELICIAESYVITHIGRDFRSLKYLKRLSKI